MANVGEMFGEIADPTVRIGTQRWYTVPLSIFVHVVVVAGVVDRSGDGSRCAAGAVVGDGVRSCATLSSASASTSTSAFASASASGFGCVRKESL